MTEPLTSTPTEAPGNDAGGETPQFGEFVWVNNRLLRHTEASGRKVWKPFAFGYTGPRRVLFIGARTLQNGKNAWTGSYENEGNYVWDADSYAKAYLVVESPRTKPFYVLPGHVCEAPE